jgi:hypothetical protein
LSPRGPRPPLAATVAAAALGAPASGWLLPPSFFFEGLKKATRWSEWKPIKIPQRNLAYILKSTQCASLLTQSRPQSYRQAIGLWNWVREMETQRKHESKQAKQRVRLREPKSAEQCNLLPLGYFIKHLADVPKKHPREHGEDQ